VVTGTIAGDEPEREVRQAYLCDTPIDRRTWVPREGVTSREADAEIVGVTGVSRTDPIHGTMLHGRVGTRVVSARARVADRDAHPTRTKVGGVAPRRILAVRKIGASTAAVSSIDARLKAEALAEEGRGLRCAEPVVDALGVARPEIVNAVAAAGNQRADRRIAIGAAVLVVVEAVRSRLAKLEATWDLNPG
jgi:hypothetical protein